MKNYWLDGIMGVVTGDALGDPIQFESRDRVAAHPVTEMRAGGAYAMPAGTWTDDSSMTLATLASISEKQRIDLQDIMNRFVLWMEKGEYTPFGKAFDEGGCTVSSILRYEQSGDPMTCGGIRESDNGNGSLMRILPACIYCWESEKKGTLTQMQAVHLIHQVSGLTHNHMRAKIGCGLYYFLVKAILDRKMSGIKETASDTDLSTALQEGLTAGFSFYSGISETDQEIRFYRRLQNIDAFKATSVGEIRSSGYVVDTLEASVWSLLNTASFRDALLKAVNLGDDADTVGAVTGGLAGLYYGYESIPKEWSAEIQKRTEIENLIYRVRQMNQE